MISRRNLSIITALLLLTFIGIGWGIWNITHKNGVCNSNQQKILIDQTLIEDSPTGPFVVPSNQNVWALVTHPVAGYGDGDSLFGKVGGPGTFYLLKPGEKPHFTEVDGQLEPQDTHIKLTDPDNYQNVEIPAGKWSIYAHPEFGLKLVSCAQ